MGFLKDRIWCWGYMLNRVPGSAPFTFEKTRCSLETQAEYLGAERCFYMNSMFSKKYVQTYFEWPVIIEKFKRLIDTVTENSK